VQTVKNFSSINSDLGCQEVQSPETIGSECLGHVLAALSETN